MRFLASFLLLFCLTANAQYIDLTNSVQGILPIANGGTGLSSPGASGNTLKSNGTTFVSAFVPGSISLFDYMSGAQQVDAMAGTLLVDQSTAFTAAIGSGYPVYVPTGTGWQYLLSATVSVPSNVTIYGDRPVIVLGSAVNNHIFRIANGANNVEIRGLELNGNQANNTGGNCIASGGTGETNIRIKNNYIHDCAANGVYFAGTTVSGILASGNYVYNNGLAGITDDSTVTKFEFSGNFSWHNGTHGIGIIGVANHGSIVGNVAWDNGQGSPSADNFTGYAAGNDDILIADNVSIGGLNNGIHFGGSNITYSGNHVDCGSTAHYGIYHESNTGNATNVTINGNSVYNCTLDGIALYHAVYGAVSGNISKGNNRGITTDTSNNITITGNTAVGNTLTGIDNDTVSVDITYTGNTVSNNGTDGIRLNNVRASTITGNTISSNGGYGINSVGTESGNVVSSNIVQTNTSGNIASMSATTSIFGNGNGAALTTTGTGSVVLSNSAALVTPALGTPASGVATNLTGTAASLTAGHVTTNANLTGPITSSGNATAINSQTGTGNKIVVDTNPALIGPTTDTLNASTSVTSPVLIGGSAATQVITYKTTTGVGANPGGHVFVGGNNGATEILRLRNDGRVGINNPSPLAQTDLACSNAQDCFRITNSSLPTTGWEFLPVSNGSNTDMYWYEFSGSSGTRAIWKSGGHLQVNGHVSPSVSFTPTIASGACGTGANGTISGTDQAGKITISSAATTSCAVTFGSSTWAATPTACVVTAASSASSATSVLPYISAISTTGFTLSGSALASTSFYFHCE